jgi:hypothetical protein
MVEFAAKSCAMGFDDIMRRVSQIKPSKPKKNAKRKK